MSLQKSETRIPIRFDLVHANRLGYSNLDGDFCMISYLPQNIRVAKLFQRITNNYVVFINDTPGNTYTYAWSFEYRNTRQIDDPNAIIHSYTESRPAHQKGIYELDSTAQGLTAEQRHDLIQLNVRCTVSGPKGTANLELKHYFTGPYSELEILYNDDGEQLPIAQAGIPHTTQLVANLYREHYPYGPDGDYQDIDIPMNIPISILYSRIAELGKSKTYFPFNKTYYENFNNNTLTLDKKDRNNIVGACGLKPHFLAMLFEETTYKRIGNDNGTIIEEEEILADFESLNDEERIDLYNLARFPKASILVSTLFVQDLLERAQTNECLNFKGSASDQVLWTGISEEDLNDHNNVIKNLLDEYIEGPQVNVRKFSYKKAIGKPERHTGSPYIEEILNYYQLTKADAPRVVDAYFAKKVVTDNGLAGLSVSFERLDSQIFGRECYIVIDTMNMQARRLKCSITTGDTVYTSGVGDKISVMKGLEQVVTITTYVGDTTVLEDEDENIPYNNVLDFTDKIILKIAIRPATKLEFMVFARRIAFDASEEAALTLEIQPDDEEHLVYYAEEKEREDLVNTPYTFCNTPTTKFTINNKRVYEIYHSDTKYNSIYNPDGRFISRLDNPVTTDLVYFFHDEIDNEHKFGEFGVLSTRRWIRKHVLSSNPDDLVDLVDVNEFSGFRKDDLTVDFMTNNSARDYIAPDNFAGLLGAMAVQKIDDIGFNGFSNANGDPGVSSSHINGVNGDLRYLRTDHSGRAGFLSDATFDYDRQLPFNESLHTYGWGRTDDMLSENFTLDGVETILPHCRHFRRERELRDEAGNIVRDDEGRAVMEVLVRHDDHLHLQGFDTEIITILNPDDPTP